MLEIYYGGAKGKSSLCVGAAVMAALREKNVLLADFSEGEDGYDRLTDKALHITRLTRPQGVGAREYFDHAVRMAMTFRYSLLILDGVFDAVRDGRLSAAEVYEFLSNAPDNLEIICTGESVDDKFLSIADEVVRMDYAADDQ